MFPLPVRWSLLEEAEWLHLREVVKGDECRERCSGWMRVSLLGMGCHVLSMQTSYNCLLFKD